MNSFTLAIIAAILFSTSSIAATTSWHIDPAHSAVSFKVKHMMISDVSGSFRDADRGISLVTKLWW